MQAIVCDRPGSLSLVERPDPRPAADPRVMGQLESGVIKAPIGV